MMGIRVEPGLVRRLVPDAFWTLANNLLSVLAALTVVKLVSLLVPAEQYGRASLVLGVVALLGQFIVNPLLTAQLRLYFDDDRPREAARFTSDVRARLARSSVIMAGGYLLVAVFCGWRGDRTYFALLLPVLILIALTPHLSAALNLLEARREYRALAYAQILTKIAPAAFLALLLGGKVPGAAAIILAQGLGFALVLSIYGRSTPRASTAGSSDVASRPANSSPGGFGSALYWFNVSSWVMTTSDRYLIEHFRSTAEVGLYTINYGFWSIPYQMLNAWLETLVRSRMYSRAAAGDWLTVRNIVQGRLLLALGLSVAGTIILFLAGRPLAHAILGEKYWRGLALAMVIAVAHAFLAIGSSFHGLFIAAKRASTLLWTSAVAATLNLGFNLWLVREAGILGAAVSTLIAYAAWALLLALCARNLLNTLIAGQERHGVEPTLPRRQPAQALGAD